MRDAAFGDDRLRKLAHLGGVAAKHRDFEAAFVIEMDVHCRDLMLVMFVVRTRQPFRQFARMVVEDIGQRRDAVSGDAVVDARPLEAKTRQIANRFGAVFDRSLSMNAANSAANSSDTLIVIRSMEPAPPPVRVT